MGPVSSPDSRQASYKPLRLWPPFSRGPFLTAAAINQLQKASFSCFSSENYISLLMQVNNQGTFMSSRDRLPAIYRMMSLPAIVAPMFLVSGPDLVLASCRAGLIGSFPFPNARTLDVLDEWLARLDVKMEADRAAGRTIDP